MAARFWVGGAGNWDDTAHWSTTSGGGSGAAVPTSSDDVTIDSNSGFAATAAISATSATSASTLAISATSAVLLLQNTNYVAGAVTLTAGTLDTNGQTCSWGSFVVNSGTKTLTLGASSITVTLAGTAWNVVSVSGWTMTANTATVTVSGAGATVAFGNKNYNGTSFVLSGSGQATINNTSATLANLTRTGTAAKTDSLRMGTGADAPTITGTVTLGGNTTQGVNRLLVFTSNVGTSQTITAAAYAINGDVDFMDINLAYSGGASWTNAGSAFIGDCGGNAGAVTTNATVSATQTATGTASFSWSTHGWTSRVPLPQDDVSIPNAFSASQTITADMPRLGRTITSTCSGSPTLNFSVANTIFGGIDLTGIGSLSGSATTFGGRSTYNITSAGLTFPSGVGYTAPGGTYTLLDAYASVAGLTLSAGTFNANGKNVTITRLIGANSTTRGLTLGSGTWTLTVTGTATPWDLSTTTGLTFSGASATIVISAIDSGVTKTFAGGGLTYGTLRHTATGSAALTITGNNTFAVLDLECTTARTITLPASGTQTITSTLTLYGDPSQLLSLVSSTPGTSTTIDARMASYSTEYASLSSDVILLTQAARPIRPAQGLTNRGTFRISSGVS